jgi:hypothetical protein
MRYPDDSADSRLAGWELSPDIKQSWRTLAKER